MSWEDRVEARLRELETRQPKAPARIPEGGGGGGFRIPTVATPNDLPAINGPAIYKVTTPNTYWFRFGDAETGEWWRAVFEHTATTIAGLPSSGMPEGDMGRATTENNGARRLGSEWIRDVRFTPAE